MPRSGVGPDPPAMARQNPMHIRQTEPGTGKLVVRVQPAERRKQLGSIGFVEARAVVSDLVHPLLTRLGSHGKADPGTHTTTAELAGVPEQILQSHPQ